LIILCANGKVLKVVKMVEVQVQKKQIVSILTYFSSLLLINNNGCIKSTSRMKSLCLLIIFILTEMN